MTTLLITGGHTGLGFEAAKQLASTAHVNLLLAGRDLGRVDAAARQLRDQFGITVTTVALDLSSLASVRTAADRIRAMLDHGDIDSLDGILCNAGAQFLGPIAYSVDGYEQTFATNYLGHFLLVNLLLDSVADGGRIVFTASGTHDPDTMDGRMVGAAVEPDAMALAYDGTKGGKPLSGGKRYTTSKLSTMLFAYELDRRLRGAAVAVASIAFDPGLMTETGLVRTSPRYQQWLSRTALMKWIFKRLGVTMGTLSFSGAALAKVASDPMYANASGKYIQSKNGTLIETRSSKVSYDTVKAGRLWKDSEQLANLEPGEHPKRLR